MSNRQERFGVLQHAITLLPQLRDESAHIPFSQRLNDAEKEQTLEVLKSQYTNVEEAHIAFIRDTAKPVNRAAELVSFFRDSVNSFAALGMRVDMIAQKIIGDQPRTPQVQLERAIRSGVQETVQELFDSVDGRLIESPTMFSMFDCNTPHGLATEAYNDGFCYPEDASALVSLILLHYLNDLGSTQSFYHLEKALRSTSCVRRITEKSWSSRSLIGYIDKASDNDLGLLDGDAYGSYVRKINKRFTSIFVDKLNTMFMASKQGDEDYFAVQDLRQRLYTLTCGVCLGVEGDPRREFDLISRAVKLAAPSNNGVINKEALESDYFSHAGNYLVSHQWGIEGDEFYINRRGLNAFCDCIESLRLTDMPSYAEIAVKIKV